MILSPSAADCGHHTPEGCTGPGRVCPLGYGCKRSCPINIRTHCEVGRRCCPGPISISEGMKLAARRKRQKERANGNAANRNRA